MWAWIKKKFRYWNLIRCKCGAVSTENIGQHYLDHVLCEYSISCTKCGSVINYWAYGCFEYPQTKTEWLYRKTVLRVQHKWWQWKIRRDMNKRFPKKKFRSKSLGPQ